MNIKTKLSIQFTITVMVIITLFSVFIYVFTINHRRAVYNTRLEDRAITISEIYVRNIENFDIRRDIYKSGTNTLIDESILIVDIKNNKIFQHGTRANSIDTTNLSEFDAGNVYIERTDKYEGNLYHLKKGSIDVVIQIIAIDTYGYIRLSFLQIVLIISWFASLLFTALMSWFFVKNILSPISDVVDQVNEININNLDARVNEGNGKDEIAQLAKTFNEMLERLELSFNLQKTFVSNASHELKTPLTSITGQLEVCLLNDRTNEEYKEILNSVLEDIKNLNLLTQQLLDFAQININNISIPFEKIRIDELILSSREDIIKRFPDFNIKIYFENFTEDENNLLINGNEHLLKITFYNLLENAYKYSFNKSVMIYFSIIGNKVKIIFKDSGIGISEEDLQKIAEPFYRSTNVINIKGHGIGLSLVKRIIQIHNGTLEATSKLNVGTSITLCFPIYNLN